MGRPDGKDELSIRAMAPNLTKGLTCPGCNVRFRKGQGPCARNTLLARMAATERHVRRRRERAHAPETPAPRTPVPGAVIEFQNISKIYESGDTGLDNVSFSVQPGEFVFLVGASGSGKSTTMRLLLKEIDATAGTLRVAGRDLNAIPRRRVPYYRRNLGVVFQDYKLLPNRTVYENVAYALQVTGGSRRDIRD